MKIALKIYLETEDVRRLKNKAEALGLAGRGAVSRYIEKLSREPVVFMDSNCKALLEALQLQPKKE